MKEDLCCYQIGPLYILSPELAERFDSFQVDSSNPADLNTDAILQIVEDQNRYNKNKGVLVFENQLMLIWKTRDGLEWIFEDKYGAGYIAIDKNYSKAAFGNDRKTKCIKSPGCCQLLQMIIECRLATMGVVTLHSSCIEANGLAYIFSADSGIGKSTRAQNWISELNASWISGDRPALDTNTGEALGVPWDGKEQIFTNAIVPIGCIVEIKRSLDTYLEVMTDLEKISFCSRQLVVPMWDTTLAAKVLFSMKKLLQKVPMYRLYCDQTASVAHEAYELLLNVSNKESRI